MTPLPFHRVIGLNYPLISSLITGASHTIDNPVAWIVPTDPDGGMSLEGHRLALAMGSLTGLAPAQGQNAIIWVADAGNSARLLETHDDRAAEVIRGQFIPGWAWVVYRTGDEFELAQFSTRRAIHEAHATNDHPPPPEPKFVIRTACAAPPQHRNASKPEPLDVPKFLHVHQALIERLIADCDLDTNRSLADQFEALVDDDCSEMLFDLGYFLGHLDASGLNLCDIFQDEISDTEVRTADTGSVRMSEGEAPG